MADQRILRDFIYLDPDRVRSLAGQLGVEGSSSSAGEGGRADRERLFLAAEPLLEERGVTRVDEHFDFGKWSPETFKDGQLVRVTGVVRLLDFSFLAMALGGLPAVLRKMSKIEMEALKNSEAGRKMSKSQLQERSTENQMAIAKVEEFKMNDLNESIVRLYGEVVRVKVRPSRENPRCTMIGSAYMEHFHDSPAGLSQKYGVEIDAGWTVLGQVNQPNLVNPPAPIPTGNQVEDAFEQIALLMNNAFRVANAPAFPNISMTPIAIYRLISA